MLRNRVASVASAVARGQIIQRSAHRRLSQPADMLVLARVSTDGPVRVTNERADHRALASASCLSMAMRPLKLGPSSLTVKRK